MRIRLYRALFIGVLCLGACITPGHVQPPDPVGTPGGGSGTAGPNRGLARKRVAAKHEPNTLVAEDGTACEVTSGRFRDVKVGDYELCLWH